MAHCDKYGIKLTAYSPMGGSPIAEERTNITPDVRRALFSNDTIKTLATKYNKSIGQILLKYQVARGVIVIPKSVTKSRIAENTQIFDFELTSDEIDQLETLNKNIRYVHAQDLAGHTNFPFNEEF